MAIPVLIAPNSVSDIQHQENNHKTVKIALLRLLLPLNASDFDKYHCNELCYKLLEMCKKCNTLVSPG